MKARIGCCAGGPFDVYQALDLTGRVLLPEQDHAAVQLVLQAYLGGTIA